MGNILDYLKWRSDLTLYQYPLCEVDNLILSQLAHLRWEVGLVPDATNTLHTLWLRMDGKDFAHGITANDDRMLLPLAAQSKRFGEIQVLHYVNDYSEEEDKQFAAVTFLLPDDSMFISFRGTDGTLVGWKEDLNLCLPNPIPAQMQAQSYLTDILKAHPNLPVYVGGHSKGGNLAMYAAATLPEELVYRLKGVYCNDAPGLSDTVFLSNGYKRLVPILHAFVPQSSIIGMLLMHPETYSVVRSNSMSILQHNPYTWQVKFGEFIRENELQNSSVYIERVLKKWLAELDDDHRRQFINTLFSILEATEAKSFGKELWIGALRNPKAMVSAIQDIDADTRQKLAATLSALANSAISNGKVFSDTEDPNKNMEGIENE